MTVSKVIETRAIYAHCINNKHKKLLKGNLKKLDEKREKNKKHHNTAAPSSIESAHLYFIAQKRCHLLQYYKH